MQKTVPDNINTPNKDQPSTTHIMNAEELMNKNKPKYIAEKWYDKFFYLLAIGIVISILLATLSLLLDFLSSIIYLTPLPLLIFLSVWLIKRLFHGKNIETLK